METKNICITTFECSCSNCGRTYTRNKQTFTCKKCDSFGTLILKPIVVEEYIEQYCPICNQYFRTSTYLNSKFTDEKVRWLANMVTHYRHVHVTSWDKCWGSNRIPYYKSNLHLDYETEKIKVNERGKRQILRKCIDQMKADGFTVNDVLALKKTERKTSDLYRKLLG